MNSKRGANVVYGFSMIELIIVIAVVIIISGTLIINYQRFIERQAVRQEALNFKQTLRQLQTKAKSGEKTTNLGDCLSGERLYGWRINITGGSPALLTYELICWDAANAQIQRGQIISVSFREGVVVNPSTQITFRALNLPVEGLLANPQLITFSSGTYICTIAVNNTGDISDRGCI